MGTHFIRSARARARQQETRSRSASAEALERRVLLSSTVCIWTGAASDQFSAIGNWQGGIAPTQPGDTAEFLTDATVQLDVPVHNDETTVVAGTVDFDLAGHAYDSAIQIGVFNGDSAQLSFSDSGAAPGGLSTGAFIADNGDLSFGSGLIAQCSQMLVAPDLDSVATVNVTNGASVSISNTLTVASQSGSFGTVNVSSGGTLSTNGFALGSNGGAGGVDGVGMLNVSGPAAFTSNGGNIEGNGIGGESTATIDGSGALWDATDGGQDLNVGVTSPGEVVVSDDASLTTQLTQLCTKGGQGSVIVSSGANWTDLTDIAIGVNAGANPQPVTSYVAVTGWDATGHVSSVNAVRIDVGESVSGQLIVDTHAAVDATGMVSVCTFGGVPNCEVDIMQNAILISEFADVNGFAPANPGIPGNTLVNFDGGMWETTSAQVPFSFGPGAATMKFDNVNSGTIVAPGGFADNGRGTQVIGQGLYFARLWWTVADAGTIAPGYSTSGTPGVATLSVDGDFDSSAGLEFEANLGAQGQSDLIAVSGDATLGGNFYATAIVDPNTYTAGDSFTVFTAATMTGQFANLPAGLYTSGTALPQLRSGYAWDVVYGSTIYGSAALTLEVVVPPQAENEAFSLDVTDPDVNTLVGQFLALSNMPGVPLTYQVATQPHGGSVTISPSTGAFVYTSNGTPGVDSFTYTVADAAATSAPATVQIYTSLLTGPSGNGDGNGVPVVTGVNPNTGTPDGGTTVTISGTGFTGATAVDFGVFTATVFTVNAAGTQITAVDSEGIPNTTWDVTVVTERGTSGTLSADHFTYFDIPPVTVTSVVINGNNPALAGAQRSMVDSIVYSFSEAVDIAPFNAFSISVLADQPGFAPELSWAPINPDANGDSAQWVVTFNSSGESIANGVYNIELNTTLVASELHPENRVTPRPVDTFFRLFGDGNGNGIVNAVDNFQFKAALTTYNPVFDVNDDGVVNATDNYWFKASQSYNFSGIAYTI